MTEINNQNYYTTIEKQNSFEIIENKYGEIAIFIDAKKGQPEHPELLFDGKKTALLRRNADLSIKLENIHEEACRPLNHTEIVMVAELDGKTVERVYGVTVEKVDEILAEGLETRNDVIRKARNVDELVKQFGAVKRWKNGEKS
ncbi:MAG: hypothetical protein AB7U85_07275 [Alphaproteobacteria bacterium]